MRKELIVASLVSLAVLAVYYGAEPNRTDAFGEWKARFGVSWAPEEEAYRRLIFEKNVIEIEAHNADHSQTYKKGVNQFTVYTEQEFAEIFLTPMPMVGFPEVDETMANLGDIDWVAKGDVSRIKNQGQCGSCWAFSATGVMESIFFIKGQKNADLSEQQLVDCTRPQGNQGCNGGWPSSALKYVQANGIASEAEYPYVGRDQACKKQGGNWKIAGFNSLSGCNGLSSGINNSPISVTVDAGRWSSYRSGVFNTCGSSINHAVLLVGIVGGNWKIKNSWGTSWGEGGYIRLATGNTCGLCQYPGVVSK